MSIEETLEKKVGLKVKKDKIKFEMRGDNIYLVIVPDEREDQLDAVVLSLNGDFEKNPLLIAAYGCLALLEDDTELLYEAGKKKLAELG